MNTKNYLALIKLFIFAFAFFLAQLSSAQNVSVPNFLYSDNIEDTRKLMDAYFGPGYKAIGAGFNTAWFNTAEVHKPGRFDIKISTGLTFANKKDKTYDARALGLSDNFNFDDQRIVNQLPFSPTVFGDNIEGQRFFSQRNLDGNLPISDEHQLAQGNGISYAPTALVQVNVGVFKGTEVAVRFVPKVGKDETKANVLGFGIKHDIKQWIRNWSLANFDLAVGFGFTSFGLDFGVWMDPETRFFTDGDLRGDSDSDNLDYNENAYRDLNQNLNFRTNAYNFTILYSKKIVKGLTVFGGPRYDMSKTKFKTEGLFPIATIENQNSNFIIDNRDNLITTETTYNQIALNGGLRWQTGAYNMALQGTLAKYPSINFSFGFGWFNK
ncbi:MAG: hypothetical protein MUE85_03250 [Microscillaceae bacterium]|jgi:hypothetical protein|nr:hypothetical protein [Microscillaceae bacterium]